MKTINVISYNNGVGLTKDVEIIKHALLPHYNVISTDAFHPTIQPADINIFLQCLDLNTEPLLTAAPKNVLIPNLEWMSTFNLKRISKFNLILAKSHRCKSILKPYHRNIIFTGFSSIDRFDPDVKKTKRFLHFAGKSIQKYTELVINSFSKSNVPITVVDATQRFLGDTTPNITYIPHYLSEREVSEHFNSHRIHICCSLAEGWGHYIHEAMSCQSVVVLNNVSPENEFIPADKAVFIPTVAYGGKIRNKDFLFDHEFPLRELNYSSHTHFDQAIQRLNSFSDETLGAMGVSSRNVYFNTISGFENRLLSAIASLG